MRSIHTEIGVGAPASTVWDILVDPARWPQWTTVMTASGRFAIGERLIVRIKLPGLPPMTITPTVTKFDPGRELRWLGQLGMAGIFDGEHGFRVVPEDVGRCRLEQFETFGGILSTPLFWVARKPTIEGFEAMNRGLKARAEAR